MSIIAKEVDSCSAPVKVLTTDNNDTADKIDEAEGLIVPPLKQQKLDRNIPVKEEIIEEVSLESLNNAEEYNGNVLNVETIKSIVTNGSNVEKGELDKDPECNKKKYRLIIYIDKIRAKSHQRFKKLPLSPQRQSLQQYSPNDVETDGKDRLQEGNVESACVGGCILRESNVEGKSTINCIRCNKRYPLNHVEIQEKTNSNFQRHKPLFSSQSPCSDDKQTLVCDICETETSTRITYEKHLRTHVSTDPLFPYKCHKCPEIFESKEDVRQHCLIMHPVIKLQNTMLQVTASPMTPQTSRQKDYRCISCNITFRHEQAFRNHINSHTKKEGLRCGISEARNVIPVPNPLTGSQIGILRAIKFTCKVCSKEFDNVGEVDMHTRTHLADAEEEFRCNICKKTFQSSAQLNEHVKHHFFCAHHCPVCSKTFINKTTLKAHLKTHSENRALLST